MRRIDKIIKENRAWVRQHISRGNEGPMEINPDDLAYLLNYAARHRRLELIVERDRASR